MERLNPSTLKRFLENNQFKFLILDARLKYEYEAGHIKGARNINSFESFKKLFQDYNGSADYVVVYCEYSLYRGPSLIESILRYDKKFNSNKRLFSKIYLLYGGFATFYRRYKLHCEGKYVSENDISLKPELKIQSSIIDAMHLEILKAMLNEN
jgi:hypothetical protein